MPYFAGTSGLITPMPKRDFPPELQDKSRLGFYSIFENSIEINSSFYKLPQAKTITRWAGEVPAGFRFTFKLWKEITHQKQFFFRQEDIAPFMEAIGAVGNKKGCLLVQFPPSLQVSALPRLQTLLPLLKPYGWPIAVEFRHPSWYKDTVCEFLHNEDAAMVIQDMPKSATPLELTTDELVYLRFHGPGGSYRGSYTDAYLYEYAQYIREWQEDRKTVYVYFNNTAGAALENLQLLKRYLAMI